MLRLSFPVFWAKKEQDTHRFTTLHCLEEFDRFTFVFKSREEWEYYTVIMREDIIAFSESSGLSLDDTIEQFRINYCSNTLPLEPEDTKTIQELTEPIEEEDYLEEPPEPVDDKYTSLITKPASVDRCVAALMADPNFKPQAGRTKEESAWAVCQAQHKKSIEKDMIIDAGEEIVKESKDYGEFLTKTFDYMEKRVLSAVDLIGLDKNYTVDKTFGEFMRNLFNVVNTATFAKHIKKFIKVDLVTGLTSAESELGVDIGWNEAYQQKLNVLSQEQLSGRTINGKKWFGIRGVSKEIQAKITATVQSGITEHKTITEIKEDIKQDFSNFTDWRAQMISRTETTKVLAEAKLIGYKSSGLDGGKVWKATQPRGCKRCSPICDRLSAKYGNNPIPLDEEFVDDETGQSFLTPYSHPNCRSTIAFRPK